MRAKPQVQRFKLHHFLFSVLPARGGSQLVYYLSAGVGPTVGARPLVLSEATWSCHFTPLLLLLLLLLLRDGLQETWKHGGSDSKGQPAVKTSPL